MFKETTDRGYYIHTCGIKPQEPSTSDADIQELKPCPFCGGEAEINKTGKNELTIRCKGCFINIEQKVLRFSLEWLKETMIKNWNKRI
jgi:hypothetical protein